MSTDKWVHVQRGKKEIKYWWSCWLTRPEGDEGQNGRVNRVSSAQGKGGIMKQGEEGERGLEDTGCRRRVSGPLLLFLRKFQLNFFLLFFMLNFTNNWISNPVQWDQSKGWIPNSINVHIRSDDSWQWNVCTEIFPFISRKDTRDNKIWFYDFNLVISSLLSSFRLLPSFECWTRRNWRIDWRQSISWIKNKSSGKFWLKCSNFILVWTDFVWIEKKRRNQDPWPCRSFP